MGESAISTACLNCKSALSALSSVLDRSTEKDWTSWMKSAPMSDVMVMLQMLNILSLSPAPVQENARGT